MFKNILQKYVRFRNLTKQPAFFGLRRNYSDESLSERSPYSNRRRQIDWSFEQEALNSVIPQIKNDILDEQLEEHTEFPQLRQRYSKLLDKTTLSIPPEFSSCALVTVHSYLQFEKFENVTPEKLKLACILAWSLRLQVSSFIVYDDILDEQEIRYNEDCWYKQVGTKEAILDVSFLESSARSLCLKYLSSHPQIINILRVLKKNCSAMAVAQLLEIESHDFKDFETKETFNKCLCVTLFPVRAAMYLANIADPKIHSSVLEYFYELNKFVKSEDDMHGVYAPTSKSLKGCPDVNGGRITWLSIQVAKHGTVSQKKRFAENIGINGEAAVKNVNDIYDEMNMPEIFRKYEEEVYNNMYRHIAELPKELPKQLFVDLLDYALIQHYRG